MTDYNNNPVPFNSGKIKSSAIPYNIRKDWSGPPSKYYSVLTEISNKNFDKILKKINNKYKFSYDFKFKKICQKSFNYWDGLKKNDINLNYLLLIANFLIKLINIEIQKVAYFKFCKNFKIYKKHILYVGKYSNYYKYVFNLLIYRKNKLTGFELQAIGYINVKNNNIYFDKLQIKGNKVSSQIINNDINNYEININNSDNANKIYANIWWKYPYKSFFSSDKNFKNIIQSNKKNSKLLKIRKNEESKNRYNLMCYNKDFSVQYHSNKILCESNKSFFEKKKKIGVWDKQCRSNYDCPYYKANKNYENNHGNCYNGKCQLPINMKLFGFRNYIKGDKFKPFCYNCPDGKIGDCCEQQKNKKLYPKLLSPDYAYLDDIQSRYKSKYSLKYKNLKWNPLNRNI